MEIDSIAGDGLALFLAVLSKELLRQTSELYDGASLSKPVATVEAITQPFLTQTQKSNYSKCPLA